MSLKPQPTNTKTYEAVPKGTHLAILYSIVDLGTQKTEYKGEVKWLPKMRLTWELPNERRDFEDKEGKIQEKPMVIGAQYTVSMGTKSNLRPVVEGMLGTTLLDQEAFNFGFEEFKELLGKACLITVVHKEKEGKVFANISTVAPLMKGMKVPEQFNESVIFEIYTSSPEDMKKLPEFMQKQILQSKEMTTDKLTDNEKKILEAHRNGDIDEDSNQDIDPSDIPFD